MIINRESEEKIRIIEKAYEKDGRLTVRRIYYILLSAGFYDLTKSDDPKYAQHVYQNLGRRLVQWRDAGLVDPDIIIDRHRELIQRPTYDNFQEAFDELFKNYSRNSMINQKRYIEVWIEKDTMRNTFIKDCYFNDVPLIIGKGYTSYTFKHEAVKRFKKYYPKAVRILAFGDFDMEGEHIPKVIKRFVRDKAPELDFDLKKVLLTSNDYKRLRQFAVKFTLKKKQLKKIYVREFIDKHGPVKLEVEAMPFDETKRRFMDALFKEIDKHHVDYVEHSSEEDKKDWLENHYKK